MFWIKDILFAAIVLFEVGSLVAGVAPNSNALIAGRAISGFGCAGVQAGVVWYLYDGLDRLCAANFVIASSPVRYRSINALLSSA